MGTVFSFHIPSDRSPGVVRKDIAPALNWLHWVDTTFSTFSATSPISRLDRGEITLDDCPPEVAEVLRRCDELEVETDGYFSARAAERLDPSGLVKGWAIQGASDRLVSAGLHDHMINGGGDIRCRGRRDPDVPWRIGIADPRDANLLVGTVEGDRLAVATSGTAERGCHIVDPHTGRPPNGLLSVTVIGPDLGTADGYATAAFAMGNQAREWLDEQIGFSALIVPMTGPICSVSARNVGA